MKSLIISDLHSVPEESMMNLISCARKKNIERVVCLGDFDEPGLLRRLLDLEMKKIIVIGNHDVALTTEENIRSPDISDPEKYWDAWEDSVREYSFVHKARTYGFDRMHPDFGVRVEEKVGMQKVCYVHGSLYSDDTCWGLQPFIRGRMLSMGEGFESVREKREANFRVMKKKKYWVLFRGHDHNLEVISQNSKGQISEESSSSKGLKFNLNKRYIATMGRFSDGGYAVFDDESRKLWLGSLGV